MIRVNLIVGVSAYFYENILILLILTSQVSRADLCDRKLHSLDPPKAPQAGYPCKNPWRSHPLKGFYRGLGVVKGKGVASAKKRSPFHLKKRKGNLNFITLVAKWGFHRNHPFGVAFAGFAPLRN